ncbi:MAG TPA: hypothetical protein VLK22_04150 [Candidatus Udaeobacter sp.]|nr:hypothetical protein [Candidatus Udaeobacter sp.]
MKNIIKLLSVAGIFSLALFCSFSSAEAASLKKYDDTFISFSYPAAWDLQTKNIDHYFLSEPIYYLFYIPSKPPYTEHASFMIEGQLTLKKIEELKNKYPSNGYKQTGVQKTTTKLSGLKAYKVISNYKDNLKTPHRMISLWTVSANDKEFVQEVWVEYDATTKFYNQHVQDALKVINSIKFK